MSRDRSPVGFLVLMVLAMVGWGGSWTSAKMLSSAAAPEVLIFWCFLFTALALLPAFPLFRESPWVAPRRLPLLLGGAALLTVYNVLFFLGLRHGLAGGGGVLVAGLSPLLVFAITTVTRRRLPVGLEALGLLLGLGGAAVFLRAWELRADQLLASGNLYFLACALLWALLTLFSQRVQAGVSYLAYSFYVHGFSALIAFFLALPRGLLPPAEGAPGFWLNVLYLGVFATAFSGSIYFLASRRLGSRRGISFMLLVPALALLISWAVLGETPAPATLAGGASMVAAVLLINRKTAGEPAAETVEAAERKRLDARER